MKTRLRTHTSPGLDASLRSARALFLVTLLGVLGEMLGACAKEDTPIPPPPAGPDRFARRFLPFEEGWIPERNIPSVPQASPHMVIWELDEHPDASPTPAQERAADGLVDRCRRVAKARDWFDFRTGLDDGFHLLEGDNRHYVNEDHLFDDALLDCERPEFLMYYGTPTGKLLAGMMFYVRRPEERGPQIGGALTRWHYHVWKIAMCMRKGLLVVGQARNGTCADGAPSYRSPEMLHVWLLDHPDGRFATTMWLTREQLETALAARGARDTE